MTHIVKDRVRETTTIIGTGPITLLGAVLGFQSFSVIGSGNTTYYTVVHSATGDWETGVGTYTSPNILARTTVYGSSNNNSAVAFQAGSKDVFCSLPAGKAVILPPESTVVTDGMTQWGASNIVGSFSGLSFTYRGGAIINSSQVAVLIPSGTISLANNSINYVERDVDGVVYSNTGGFSTSTRIPIAKVTTVSGSITAVVDWRLAAAIPNVLSLPTAYVALDVRKFGVKCDGTTDDTVKWLDAISSGEALVMPANTTSVISGTLTFSANPPKLRGSGEIILAPGSNCEMLVVNGVTLGNLKEFALNGNKSHQTIAHPVMRLRNAAYTRIEGLHIHDSKGIGLQIENYNASAIADEINLQNSFIFANDGDGVLFTYIKYGAGFGTVAATAGAATFLNSQNGIVSNGSIITIASTPYTVSAFNGTNQCTLSGSPTFGSSTFTIDTIQAPGDCIITNGNHINYNGGHGIHLRGGTSNIINSTQILTNDGHGIFLEGISADSMYCYRINVGDIKSRNNGGSGLYSYAGGGLYRGGGLQIHDNEFHFNNRLGGGASNLDIWDTDVPQINDNLIGDLNFTARAAYGLTLSRATNARINGNTLINNVADFQSVNSSTYVSRGNYGIADN